VTVFVQVVVRLRLYYQTTRLTETSEKLPAMCGERRRFEESFRKQLACRLKASYSFFLVQKLNV